MDSIVKKLSGRFSWLLFPLTAAFAAAALRGESGTHITK